MSRDDFLNMSLDLDLDFSVQAAHRPLSSSTHGAISRRSQFKLILPTEIQNPPTPAQARMNPFS